MLARLQIARARAGAPLALLLAAALAGCGGSAGNGIASKSPSEILAASNAAALSATSVHVVDKNAGGPLSLTLNLELAGDGGRAQLSLLGVAFEEIRIANTLYVKGNPFFYKRLGRIERLGATVHVPKGTWLKAPANSGKLAQLAAFTERRELALILRSTGPLTKGAASTVNGQQVIELKEAAKLFTGSLFIATTGKPYPIQLVKHGKESGQITFTGWNQAVSLAAPANAVELAKLEHRGH